MARFEAELPTELLKQMEGLSDNAEDMLKDMTQAGADTVVENVMANLPSAFRDSEIMKCLKKTRAYKTPSDDGINTKVAFYGYFVNKEGKRVPAPLVCNLFEHGRSDGKYPKHPFMRKSFRKSQIEAVMMKVQEKYIGGGE